MFSRISLAFLMFALLSACEEPTLTGGGVIESQAVSVSLQGVSSNGLTLDGQMVSINGQSLGLAKRLPGQTTQLFSDNTVLYEPLQTSYGELELRGIYPALGNAVFEVYIDGALVSVVPIPAEPTVIII